MITYGELFEAYQECYINKKRSPGAMEFLFDYQRKLRILLKEINNRTYEPRPSTVFIITDPKIREVFAADFRDRIIHHLIIKELLPLFQSYFIPESFSCMPGRGTLFGIKTLASFMDSCERDWYVMKMDVSSFFMNIRRSWLEKRLEEFIRYNYKDERKLETLIWLVRVTVFNDPTKNCIRRGDPKLLSLLPKKKSLFYLPEDKGLPIGNYSSQMFANFYMTPLDYFIKSELGFKFYGRYVDDFVIFGPKQVLMSAAPKIRLFSKINLDLEISESKFYLQPYYHGVKFLGSMIMPRRIYCGNRVRGLLINRLRQFYPGENIEKDICSINSYLGLIKQFSSYNVRRDILLNLPNGWDLYIKPGKDYNKVLKT